MAYLQFDQLYDVMPAVEHLTRPVSFSRDVDSRSVTFESGINVTLSDFMSSTFEALLAVAYTERTQPQWLNEAWDTVLSVINSQKLGDSQQMTVISFLLGRADHLTLYVR